ncbi:MAG: hypothetical protein GC178_05215 [Flavobacteriales bacterium]|nr:hypothetical protein [Flavobacteriales bacterium]
MTTVVCISSTAFAQDDYEVNGDSLMNRSNIKGPLDFKGHVIELSKKLKGAIVVLYQSEDGTHDNLTEVLRTVTPGSGEFTFKAEVNKFYVLSVEKSGYTTKMVDIDTDVRSAREQYTTVPTFEFQVDMVPDLDGLPFSGSVASVFYYPKQNKFDYQLDYSKEDIRNEEKELREREEKQRLAELAYEKKKELEEAAKLLLEKENATAQQLIEAAITVGDGDEAKTKKGFMEVFSEVDTLREKKVDAMYAQLLEERKQSKATGNKINFQAIFNSAKTVEEKVVKEAEEERQAQVAILKAEKEEAEHKSQEAMEIAQKAIEVQESERLAAAIAEEEARKKQEELDKRNSVYYAIFNSGSRDEAVQSLIKTYPKGDKYAKQKAEAIYDAYEKERMGGTTLSAMDFNKLFNAADLAEQNAIQKEIADDNSKQQSKLDAFMQRVEEKKREEQEQTKERIMKGLVEASSDRASQIAAFKDALPKNESFKDEKAEVMYEEYLKQKKALPEIEKALKAAPANDREAQIAAVYNALPEDTYDRQGTAERIQEEYVKSKQAQGGTGSVKMDFGSLFKVAEVTEEKAKEEEKIRNAEEKQRALEMIEAKREDVRQQKREMAVQAEKVVEATQKASLAEAKTKKERQLAEAIESGGGDRDKSVAAIQKVLQTTDDKELDRYRAEEVYDSYLEQSEELRASGNSGGKVDFSKLFAAADQAELKRLQRQFEAKQLEEQEKLAKYEEERTQRGIEIAKAEQKQGEKQAEQAEIAYEETLHKVEVQRQERLAEEKKQAEELAKQMAMEQAKREALEQGVAAAELERIEKERQARLEKERKEQQALADAEAARRQKEQEEAERQAKEQLALLEKQRRDAEAAEQKRLAAEEKQRQAEELAAAKAADDAKKAEEKRLAEEEKQRQAEELAAAKEAEDARKAEEKRQKELEDEQKRKALEEARLAEQARIDEEKRIEAEEKARKEAEIAAAKAAEEARIAEEKRKADELAAAKAAEEAERKANYDKLMSKADADMAKQDFRNAWKNYKDALALYPDDKQASKKFAEADVEVKRLDKEEAEQLALDERYNELINNAEEDLKNKKYQDAKTKFEKASELKPGEQAPKQQIRNIDRTLDEIAAAEKERIKLERKYVLLMQEGSKALESSQLDVARSKYEEAASIKPEEGEPVAKLKEVEAREEEVALAKEEEARRKEQAKRDFEKKQKEEAERKAAEQARIEAETEARLAALTKVDEAKQQQQKTAAELEQERQEKYAKLQQAVEDMGLTGDERRQAFLSELAKIYPSGLTKETVQGKNFVLLRHVINENNVVTIYEKKTWDWGGVFYFKNSDIAITEALYKLEIGKYE